jgi:hypothetical protein
VIPCRLYYPAQESAAEEGFANEICGGRVLVPVSEIATRSLMTKATADGFCVG